MPNKSSDKVEIRIKVDKDLVDWLMRISKYLAPYTVDDIVVNVLKFYMNTWLMIENAIRHEQLHQQQPLEEDSARQKSFESTKQLLGAEPSDKISSNLQRILRYRRLVKSFSEWLSKQGIPANSVTEDRINAFIEEYLKMEKSEEVDPTVWKQVLHDVLELKKSRFDVDGYIAKHEVVAKYKGLVNSFVQWLASKGKDPNMASREDIKEFLNAIKHGYSKKTIAGYYKILKYYLDLYKAGEDLNSTIGTNK